jgi:hypothetical protein
VPRMIQRNVSTRLVNGFKWNKILYFSGTIEIGNIIGVIYIQIIMINPSKFFVSRKLTINAPKRSPTPDEKIIVMMRMIGIYKNFGVTGKPVNAMRINNKINEITKSIIELSVVAKGNAIRGK